ncbi:piwi domain-containing protein [Ditylenchus destructor]|uniref:Piwi domain-containing protein n=1 Tax=Ditylenchus destructor TaxID=166010 RepID=A0AAD4R6H2_9BILA|nr:piwi domain-containing protein [Ditylenchus destructor]
MADPSLTASMAGMGLEETDQEHRYSTALESKAETILREAGGEIGSTVMPSKKRDTAAGSETREKLTTNVYGIAMKEDVIVFRYMVSIQAFIKRRDGKLATIDMSTKHSKDAFLIERRDRCRDIYNGFSKMAGNPVSGSRCIYYDLESILFSLDKIGGEEHYDVPIANLPPEYAHFAQCVVSIRPVDNGTQLRLGDLSGLSLELSEVYRTLGQFLDLATGQHAIFDRANHVTFSAGQSFLMSPEQYGFRPEDGASFDSDAAYLAIGCDKGVRYIEGPGNRPSACAASLVVQTKKTPFHNCDSLLAKAQLLMPRLRNIRDDDRIKLEKLLKGLVVETSHGKRRQMFVIDGISRDTARSKKITVDDAEITVEQYFKQMYEWELSEPNTPLVESGRSEDKMRFFPLEVCTVSDNQRVKTHQLSPMMTQASIKKCAVPPAILLEQNAKIAKALNLWDSKYLKAANISITNRPIDLDARALAPPKILFGGNTRSDVRTMNFTWQGTKFIFPANFDKWAAFAFLDERDKQKLNMRDFEDFIKRFIEECRFRGAQIEQLSTQPKFYGNTTKDINTAFDFAFQSNALYVLAIHAEGGPGDIPHADVKFAERQYGIVSQCVTLSTVLNVLRKNQRVTMQNIVNKANVKYGGLNYSLAPDAPRVNNVLRDDTLFIGFGSNHPGGGFGLSTPSNSTPGSGSPERSGSPTDQSKGYLKEGRGKMTADEGHPPTVIGYSANIGPNSAFDFVGDFAFQEPQRQEVVSVIADIVARCVEMFQKRRGYQPARIVIYRGGCSDSMFKMILKYEVPFVKLALKALECASLITVIAVNKLQNVRFFKQNINRNMKPPEQNIQPGTVVDQTVTHPLFAEFFLNSHRALQGTARTPKYTVLYDDNNMNMTQVEEMTYLLCYGHQIVYMPTSMPSPVYIANCYADRGRSLYQRWIAQSGKHVDYQQLTNSLSFASSMVYPDDLYGFRVNA